MRNIYLVRHGKPEFPEGRKCCIGWTDLPLSEEGRSQIESLKEELIRDGGEEIEAIYTSPLKRCVESAEILSGGRIPIRIAEDMKEIGMGEWEGLPFSVIRERYPEEYERRGRDIAGFAPPGGESFLACQKRAKKAWERIRRESRGNVILVAHAGFNRTLISDLEGRELKNLLEIPQEYGTAYAYRDFIFDGLIVAAGLSSRMGDFKALMDLGGKRVIDRELDTLRAGGAREIAVVTGHRAGEIEKAVREHVFTEPGTVTCLHNAAYAETKMFDSVCIGLRHFLEKGRTKEGKSLDGIFFLPVDVPLFTRFTMEREKKEFARGKGDVYCPYSGGQPGHPLLIRAEVFEKLLAHNGEQGLKGAYERLGDRVIPIFMMDQGAVMDADTREDFSKLQGYEKARAIPGEAMCRELLSWFQVKEETRKHCEAVAELAVRLGENTGLNIDLIRAGALLHDIAKGRADHAAKGAGWLSMMGHEAVACVVADHMDLPEEKLAALNESLIVYLADKMTQGDRHVTIEERFAPKRERFKDNPEALAALERRYERAKRAEEVWKAADRWETERGI